MLCKICDTPEFWVKIFAHPNENEQIWHKVIIIQSHVIVLRLFVYLCKLKISWGQGFCTKIMGLVMDYVLDFWGGSCVSHNIQHQLI